MPVEAIFCMDENYGLGCEGRIPWSMPEDLALFKQKTMGKILVCGRKTAESLPELKGRTVYYLSRTYRELSPCIRLRTLRNLSAQELERTMIIGGADVFRQAFGTAGYIKRIHLSIVDGTYPCDVFVDRAWLNDYVAVSRQGYNGFTHYVLESMQWRAAVPDHVKAQRPVHGEQQYLQLLRDVLNHGSSREGRNGGTRSLFNRHMTFDLNKEGFPLLTTKKMFMRGIAEELLFFLRGDTDSTILEEKKVNIWKGNTSRAFLDSIGMHSRRQGVMGPIYGYNWRHFGAAYDETRASPREHGIDQLARVIQQLKTEPTSRRILMTSYNPAQVDECVLPPCHSVILQFYADGVYLDMFCYNRSQDVFLGTPFNIASSALLLTIVARLAGFTPRLLNMSLGDVHIYYGHVKQCIEQVNRIPYAFPRLTIRDGALTCLDDLHTATASDVNIVGYRSHYSIKADMVA